ncbi:MAG: hypothetical protein QXI33_00770 [Candidatus Pacearchaeota archaeon]
MRVKFLEKNGQRKFMKDVLVSTNCPSLRSFGQFGLDIPYSTMKNYYSEKRIIPKNLFDKLCYMAKFNNKNFKIEFVSDYWGQSKGGKKSKRLKFK